MNEVEGKDYVICKICGKKSGRIYGRHLKSHGITSKEYKDKFPGEPLMANKDFENTSKVSGLHMKQEKYKKMFSEKFKGKKNPNHKSKTSEKERKERSPFCEEFKNYNSEEDLVKFRELALKDRKHTTRIEYYLEQGYNEEESKRMLSERQSTFSLEICIQKYGEIEGKKIFTERQKTWQDSLYKNGNLKFGYSKISQELFYKILEHFSYDDKKEIYFATKNQEISFKREDRGGLWIYDFCDKKRMKIIEYNGDEYHGNPKKYKASDRPHPFRKQHTAQDIWDKDAEKVRIAKQEGFEVLTIWDSEFKKGKENAVKKCIKFLIQDL